MKWIITAFVILLCLILFLWFAHDQNKRIVVTNYKLQADIPSPLQMVHLSDLHSTHFKKLLTILKEQQPDIILITGDLINDKGMRINEMLEYIRSFSKLCPVYYVTGNHERRLAFFEELMLKIEEAGAHALRNSIETIKINEVKVNILGLDENQGSFHDYKEMAKGKFQYKDNSQLFHMLEQMDGFKLVMTHYPENFACIGDYSYNQFQYDLMLAGHAHGGQFDLPFIGPVFSPGQGLFPKYAKGIHGTKPKLVVSRGMGNSEFPLRLFNHPEVIKIKVENESVS